VDSLGIDGAWTHAPRIYPDNRGNFHEWFRGAEFLDAIGYRFGLAQANCSVSRRGVIRGIHFTQVPPGQAKYVICASGAILDVIVDLRAGSPTFAGWKAVQLDDETRRAVFICEGLGHAFVALSAQATVMYLCSTPYAPGIEHGVHPLDPALGIEWPQETEPTLSDKDAAAPTLDQAQRSGLLPGYGDCLAFAARLKETAAAGPDHPAGAPGQAGEPPG
jgi:dTDP-4-dehydrorhamnose 3,5-epimerase